MVAGVVAASETILYIIWESRKSAKKRVKARRLVARQSDGDGDVTDWSLAVTEREQIQQYPDGLRQRIIPKSSG